MSEQNLNKPIRLDDVVLAREIEIVATALAHLIELNKGHDFAGQLDAAQAILIQVRHNLPREAVQPEEVVVEEDGAE